MALEDGSPSGDDNFSDSNEEPRSAWEGVFSSYAESDTPNRSTKARDVLEMILKNYEQGLFSIYAETGDYLQQNHQDLFTAHKTLVHRAIQHLAKKDNTIRFEFYALGDKQPFTSFKAGDISTGPAVIYINTDHPSVDYSLDEVHLPSVIDLFNSLVAAQVYIQQNPYFNQDKELIYTELRDFLETPYFVNPRIQLDEESWGVMDIKNSSDLTIIVFPFVGFESSAHRSRELTGNQTYYLKGENRIKFFRFILDMVPFSAPSKEHPEIEILEGITLAAEDDFLPTPRLQLTRKEYDVADDGQKFVYNTETIYMDLSPLNRQNILRDIQGKIANRDENKPLE